MNDLVYFFAGGLAVVALMTSISVWAPRQLAVRVTALVLATLFIPLGYASLANLLSRPKPVALEWLQKSAPEATVLGSTIDEGKNIFVWLQMPGGNEPRAYALPWSRDVAEQLQEAQREAQAGGTAVLMRTPFEPSWDTREPRFYAAPQPAMPPKDWQPGPPPVVYQHPSAEA
jgi:hypothetical protein